MSTNALIIFQNVEGICNAVSVQFDGYIEGGVGEILNNHWNNEEDIKKLCSSSKSIRSFGNSFDEIEYYNDPISKKLAKSLQNVDNFEVLNRANNFNYGYIWREVDKEWIVLHHRYGERPLKKFF